jgi:hypothetical protein
MTTVLARRATWDTTTLGELYDGTAGPAYRLALCLTSDRRAAERLVRAAYREVTRGPVESGDSRVVRVLREVHRLGRASESGAGPA